MINTLLLNRYRLDAELGHGGMGTVYRVYDTLLDRPVAVKVVSNTALGTEGRARLLREARAAAKLNHPNIMTIYDAGEENNLPFIVIELIAGQSLREAARPSVEQTVEIAKQICAALKHAHDSGIIHRDLKPDNVMVVQTSSPRPPLSEAPFRAPESGQINSGEGGAATPPLLKSSLRFQESHGDAARRGPGGEVRVKLMDFGLAFSFGASRLTREDALVGTAAYLAPELIEGKPASAASDLYALGVMLYELLAGQLPFSADNIAAMLSQHLYAPVTPASTYNAAIPPAFDLLILRLLAKLPEQRPASASEVRQMLDLLSHPSLPGVSLEVTMLDRIVRGRLIGREPELAEANIVWQQARAGAGQVLLISGEPGIGKTRFTRELMAQARLNGGQVLLGECYAEGSAPYAPLAQAIQTTLDLTGFQNLLGLPSPVLADLITLAPALRATFPDVPPNLPLEALAEQQRLFESVVSFFAALSAQAPVLLVIDDAHWADSATLSLLRHLARRTVKTLPATSLRLLIVLTYREIELDEARAFYDVLTDLDHERLATRLKLTRLDKDQTRDLLATMFQEEITSDFLNGIYRETEGNPFFVEEVCKALIAEGQLRRESGQWKRPGMEQLQIPQSIKLAIQRRVGKLPEAAQETLRLAAVLGREFEFDALQAMSDLDEDRLVDALELAQRAQLINEVPRTSRTARLSFAFAHALIPTTLRERLSSLRRQRLHKRAAQALERIHADRLDTLAAQLGQHYAEAGDGEKAIEYLLKAGDQARRVYAYDEAIEHYQQALTFLKDSGPDELVRAARTEMSLGGLYHSVLNFEQSQQAYDEAFALWQRSTETPPPVLSPAPHAFRLYWENIRTLDLTLSNDVRVGGIVEQLFSGLVESTPDFDLVPMLARRWEILDDGRRYMFHLRRDARWSDNRPVTAYDFECAWRRTLDPATRSPNAEYLYPIKNARAIRDGAAPLDSLGIHLPDEFTLTVELEEPTGYFLQLLTCSATFAVPCHVVETYGAAWCEVEHLVTNGPFRLAEWIRGDKLILTRNPDYHGRFSGNLQRIELTLRPADQWTFDRYDTGEHDTCMFPDLDLIPLARQQHPKEYANVPTANAFYIGFDATRPPFDDVRVRQAFVHAVDRKTLCEVVLRNLSTPATGGFVPPGLPGHTERIGLAYNPERAKRLLAEAGYPQGRGFPGIEAWRLLLTDDRHYRFIQAQWRENLGVEVTWQTFEWNEYNERLSAHTPHLFAGGWLADYPDPDSFLRVGLHQPGTQCWHNAQYEQLLDAARRISDPVERLKFYQAADRLLVQEAGIMPFSYGQWHVLFKPWVKYPISALSAHYWKDVILEEHE